MRKDGYSMTEKMIENRIRKLQEIEARQKELEASAEAIRAELKADLEGRGRAEDQKLHCPLERDRQQPFRWKSPESRFAGRVRPVLQGQQDPPLHRCMRKAPCITADQSRMQRAATTARAGHMSIICPVWRFVKSSSPLCRGAYPPPTPSLRASRRHYEYFLAANRPALRSSCKAGRILL